MEEKKKSLKYVAVAKQIYSHHNDLIPLNTLGGNFCIGGSLTQNFLTLVHAPKRGASPMGDLRPPSRSVLLNHIQGCSSDQTAQAVL